MSKQSGPSHANGGCAPVRRYTMSKQSGPSRCQRLVCTGAPVHYQQTVREEEDAARVCGYTGTL